MSDHIEAMVKALPKRLPDDPVPDWYYPKIAAEVWAAAIEALIAHEPCGGTNKPNMPDYDTYFERWGRCEGPHTVIDKGDGTKLYAEQSRPVDVLIGTLVTLEAWPSEWRIE